MGSCCYLLLAFLLLKLLSVAGQTKTSFPDIVNTVAGNPSQLWSTGLLYSRRPLPTNTFWLNFVLGQGNQPEYIHPYSVKSDAGRFSLCYPKRLDESNAVIQVHTDDISVSCSADAGAAATTVVSDYADMSVLLSSWSGRLRLPLVRGSPYVTFLATNCTPVFQSIHALLNLSSNAGSTKHKLLLNNGQTWIIYSSAPLSIAPDLSVNASFTGVIRLALLPDAVAEQTLDAYSTCFPLRATVTFPAPFVIHYDFATGGIGELLMLTLPLHRANLFFVNNPVPNITYDSIDGQLQGILGRMWTLRTPPLNVSWYAGRAVSSDGRTELAAAVEEDVAALPAVINITSTYYFGKAAARAARLAVISLELQLYHLIPTLRQTLAASLEPWLTGGKLGYDRRWGGVVSAEAAVDPSADFGLGLYNDHHFHFGYFVYAAAVLSRLDPAWAALHQPLLRSLVYDYMSLYEDDFPRLRHFDPWLLHSWAGGLDEFADGRNQESTSEAMNAYYAASLLGLSLGDGVLAATGATLAAAEAAGAAALWHLGNGSRMYGATFDEVNRVVGIVWANKRDAGLWFAPAAAREIRLGIQLLPLTPATELLFSNSTYNRQLVDWAAPAMWRPDATDAWRGFSFALQATYHPAQALDQLHRLKGFDDGNSYSNLLWWAYTRSGEH